MTDEITYDKIVDEQMAKIAALTAERDALRDALERIIGLGGAYGSRAWMAEADAIARAALKGEK